MPISNLQTVIRSSRLGHLLRHWHETRHNRPMPAWEDIRPAEIKAELPIMWSYRYDAQQDDFVGGIAGDAIQRLLGGPIKNMSFSRVHHRDYAKFFARAKRVMFQPAIFLGRGLLFEERERQCYGERIILPFSSEDGRTKGIIGATDFKFSFMYQSGQEARDEVEQWISLPASPELSLEPAHLSE